MRRAVPLLLLLVAPRAFGDAATDRYRQFFKEEIEGRYAGEAVSDVRAVMLRDFQKHDVPDAARWLITDVLPKEEAGDALREAVRVLGTYNNPDTVDAMAALYRSTKSAEVRTLLQAAFGRMKIDTAVGPIEAGIKDRDERVAAAACIAAGTGRRIGLRADLEGALKHKHPAVRAAALRGLRELGGDESLPLVFQSFCTDASPRVRYDAWLALTKLAKEDLPCDPEAWEEFWKKMAGEPAEGETSPWGTSFPRVNAKAGKAVNFFGIPVLGERVCLVLDTSRDMATPWRIDHQEERRKPPEERIPNFFNVKTRWSLVRAYVLDFVGAAPAEMEFGFVFFNETPTPWPEKGRFMKNRGKTAKSIETQLETRVQLASVTAMYEGLAAGWGFVKGGDPEANFDKGADTILFVTDGRPTHGELANRPERLSDECWRIAVTRHVRFHTVGLHNHQFDLLQAMARDSDGLYVHFQQAGDTAEPQDLEFWPKKKKAFEEARKAERRGGGEPGE